MFEKIVEENKIVNFTYSETVQSILFIFENYLSMQEIVEIISKEYNDFELVFESQIKIYVKDCKITKEFYKNDKWKQCKFKSCKCFNSNKLKFELFEYFY